ncbi:MAG: hypothetical protein WC890_08270 [Candidatus Margulisiibacteriota bacterium]
MISATKLILPLLLLAGCGRPTAKPTAPSPEPKATTSEMPGRPIIFKGPYFENILQQGAIDVCSSEAINGKSTINSIDKLWDKTAESILEKGAILPDGYVYHSSDYANKLNPYQQKYAVLLLADLLAKKFENETFNSISSGFRRWIACATDNTISKRFADLVPLRITDTEVEQIIADVANLYMGNAAITHNLEPGEDLTLDSFPLRAPQVESQVRKYSLVVELPDSYELYLEGSKKEGSKKYGPLGLTVSFDKDGEANTNAKLAFSVTHSDLAATGSSEASLVLYAQYPGGENQGTYPFANLGTVKLAEPEAPVATRPARGTGTKGGGSGASSTAGVF